MIFSWIPIRTETQTDPQGPSTSAQFVRRAKELGVTKCPACNRSLVEKPAQKRKKHG